MNVTDKTGKVISVRQVGTDDQVVLITDGGKVIRLDGEAACESPDATRRACIW